MAETLGLEIEKVEIAGEKNIESDRSKVEDVAEEPVQEIPGETAPVAKYEFNDIPGRHYEGILVHGEQGYDYISNAGSMRAACEAMPGGAPIEKVLSLYIRALSGPVVRRFDNPKNPSRFFEHTITSH